MQIQDFLQILVVGAALSLLIQFVKNKWSLNAAGVKGFTLALSLVIGVGYVLLRDTPFWQTIVSILMTASTVWAFFMNEGGNTTPVSTSTSNI